MKRFMRMIVACMLVCSSSFPFMPIAQAADHEPVVVNDKPSVEYDQTNVQSQSLVALNNFFSTEPKKGIDRALSLVQHSNDSKEQMYALELVGVFGKIENLKSLQQVIDTTTDSEVAHRAQVIQREILIRDWSKDPKSKSKLVSLLNQQASSQDEELSRMAQEKLLSMMQAEPKNASIRQAFYKNNEQTSESSQQALENVADKSGDYQVVRLGDTANLTVKRPAKEADVTVTQMSTGQEIISHAPITPARDGSLSYRFVTDEKMPVGLYNVALTSKDKLGHEQHDVFTLFVSAQNKQVARTPVKKPQTSAPSSINVKSSTVTANAVSVSQYEPNDSISSATSITVENSYTAYIGTTTDRDYYKFTPSTSGLIYIDLSFDQNDNFAMDLVDSSGKVLEKSTVNGNALELHGIFKAGITYYLYVYGISGSFDALTPYTLDVGTVTPATDTNEINDAITSATSIALSSSISSYLSYDEDKDYYKITASANGLETISLQLPPNTSYEMDILDSSGNYVGGTTYKDYPNVAYTFAVASTKVYYAVVYDDMGDSSPDPYTIKTSAISAFSNDTYEPNDSMATAYALTEVTSSTLPTHTNYQNSSSISRSSDADWYKFTPGEGMIAITFEYPVNKNYYCDVMDANGTIVTTLTFRSQGNAIRLGGNLAAKSGQPYYLKVYGDGSSYGTDLYTLQAELPVADSYELNDTPDHAVPLALGQTISSTISTSYDVDQFVLTPDAEGDVNFEIDAGDGQDEQIQITSDTGSWTAYATSASSAVVTVHVQAGQRYDVLVTPHRSVDAPTDSPNGPHNYTLKVSNPIAGDPFEPNDTASDAKSVNPLTITASLISSETDVDLFRFTPQSSGAYHLSLHVPTDKNYDVQILDADQNVIVSGTAGTGTMEELTFNAKANQTYYVQVTGVSGDFSTSESYKFIVAAFTANYTYNSLGELTELDFQNGSHKTIITFVYDRTGNLISRTRTVKELL